MTTWNTPSDKDLKSGTENAEDNSENIWADFTEDFHQALHDTDYSENLSDDLLLSTEHKENTPRKKAKRTEKTRRLGNRSTKKLKFDENDFFQNLIDSSSPPNEDEIPVKPSPNPSAEKITPVSVPQPTVIPVTPPALMSGKNKPSMNIDQIANAITKALTIILHDNCLYYYTGKCYQIIEDSEELLRVVRSKVRQDAFSSYSKKKFDDLFTYMRVDERLIPDDYEEKLQKSADYVSLKNGVLNLKKLKLLAHNKKFLIFYSLDADWIEEPESQSFDGFLSTISGGSPEIKTRIIESMGYLLSSCNKGKCFFVMGTAPNSGKSTLGEFLQRTLGNKLVTSKSIAQIPGRFSMGDIQGKLLNLSLDLPKGKFTPIVVSIIKQITGGDSISIERKYDKLRDIHSTMRFLFASNYPVTISRSDEDDAYVREFRLENAEEYSVKDEIKADIFAAGDKIDATAISKGKGFQGAIKRHGQHRGPMAHGSKFHRHQGSNGSATTPGRVFKGKGMPGHMGSVKVTVQNLEVVKVDTENNLLLVKGSVPGPKKSLVTIKETVKVAR